MTGVESTQKPQPAAVRHVRWCRRCRFLSRSGPPVIAEPKGIDFGERIGQIGWHREQSAPRPNRMRALFVFERRAVE